MRILFVGDAFSVHTARWISQLHGTGWEIHLFDPGNGLIHEDLKGITLYTGWKKPRPPRGTRVVYRWPFTRGRHFVARRFPWLWRWILPSAEKRLGRLLRRRRFDCIHSFGLQLHSEVVLSAREGLAQRFPPWIYSSRGSDIYFHRHQPDQLRVIKNVLQACDYFIGDCDRDIRLASEHGFTGVVLGVFPGGGGYPIAEMRKLRGEGAVSTRRTIAVKGLETQYGNALKAVEALERCAPQVKGYTLKFYQAHPETRAAVKVLADRFGMDCRIIDRAHFRRIWETFGESRLSIGISRSDGVPNAMLESMIMGALPIQTDPGGATSEWIRDGVNGLIVPHDDAEAIAAAIKRALADDRLVDAAASLNWQETAERLDETAVRARALECYRRVL